MTAVIAETPAMDVRDFLKTIAAVASEGAETQDPQVLNLALRVLAKQSMRFATLSEKSPRGGRGRAQGKVFTLCETLPPPCDSALQPDGGRA